MSSKIAKTVTLTPVNDVVTIDKEFTDFVKNRLKGLPITHGDEIFRNDFRKFHGF